MISRNYKITLKNSQASLDNHIIIDRYDISHSKLEVLFNRFYYLIRYWNVYQMFINEGKSWGPENYTNFLMEILTTKQDIGRE